MSLMLRTLKWIVGLALTLIVLIILAILILRALPLKPEQAALLDRLLTEPVEPEGRNAFAALWLLPYDAPPEEVEALMAEELARVESLPIWPDYDPGQGDTPAVATVPTYASVAAERFAAIPGEDIDVLCQSGSDCLRHTRASPEPVRAAFERNPELAARSLALADYDFLRNRFPPRMSGPQIAQQFGLLLRTLPAALTMQAIDQGPLPALAENCRQLDAWRGFSADANGLIQRMLSIRLVGELATMSAALLAELPDEVSLPDACIDALAAPEPGDWDMCPAMAAEFRLGKAYGDHLEAYVTRDIRGLERLARSLFFDPHRGDLWRAKTQGAMCAEPLRELMAHDRPGASVRIDATIPWHECGAALATCALSRIGAQAYVDYADRSLDHAARLRLLAAAVWLREHTDRTQPLAERLAALPGELRGTPERNLSVTEDGASLQITLYGRSPEPTWSIPVVVVETNGPAMTAR